MQVNDIWRVYYFDEEWCKLQARKKSLKRLFEQCRDYQYDKVCGDMEAPIPEDEKMVSDQDLERIDSITMFEELKDMEEHFRFYYSRDRDQIKVPYSRENKQCLFKTHAVFGRAYFRAFSKFILYFGQFQCIQGMLMAQIYLLNILLCFGINNYI